jgi:two-component system sensor histidine kinase KdpD
VSGQSGFAACPPLRKLLKPSGEQALRPDFISFLGVLNNYKSRGNCQMSSEKVQTEHVLVCLSPSPSNERLIRRAARLSEAFQGYFTALYIETPDDRSLPDEDRQRLESNEKLAQKLGAQLEIIQGSNVAGMIAEYARASGVTKIVIGRSTSFRNRLHPGGKNRKLIDTLILLAPDADVYIIPDQGQTVSSSLPRPVHFEAGSALHDFLFSAFMLGVCSLIGWFFQSVNGAESNIIVFYIFFVFLISIRTASWICSLCASAASVFIFNFLFTSPHFSLRAYDAKYTLSFAVMFVIALLTGINAARLKNQARNSARMAFRIQILYDMNQMLEKSTQPSEIMDVTARQLIRLLKRNIIVYPASQKKLQQPYVYLSDASRKLTFDPGQESAAAEASFSSMEKTGHGTAMYGDSNCVYYSVRLNHVGYGVIGIDVSEKSLNPYTASIVVSMLSETALALENNRSKQEMEQSRLLAKNEQLRANLLRSISHDLRTPLTSISGAASILLSDGDKLDTDTKSGLYQDIYDDSMWLEDLVENLLSITRLSDGEMELHTSAELMGEVIQEARRHCSRKISEHIFRTELSSDLLMGKMDARLIVQLIVNLINNAVKYTPPGSHITVHCEKEGDMIQTSVSDDGPGIEDQDKEHIFDMFYCGKKTVADSRRSMGLGLALCKSIAEAHGGSIRLTDNQPHGCIFTFTIPAEEVPEL